MKDAVEDLKPCQVCGSSNWWFDGQQWHCWTCVTCLQEDSTRADIGPEPNNDDLSFKGSTGVLFPEPPDGGLLRQLKRPALLFERFGVFQLSSFQEFIGKLDNERLHQLNAELDWLGEKGLVQSLQYEGPEDFFKVAANNYPNIQDGDMLKYCCSMTEKQFIATRLSSLTKRPIRLMSYWPSYLRNSQVMQPVKHDILRIVLEKFPLPSEDTSWESILEFRSTSENKQRALDLRHWMTNIARQNLSPSEIEDELEWLMSQYDRHMKLHRMKAQQGALEIIVTGTAEAIENVIKLKFGAFAKSLFAVKRTALELAEAELTAPGREIAYIVKGREQFR